MALDPFDSKFKADKGINTSQPSNGTDFQNFSSETFDILTKNYFPQIRQLYTFFVFSLNVQTHSRMDYFPWKFSGRGHFSKCFWKSKCLFRRGVRFLKHRPNEAETFFSDFRICLLHGLIESTLCTRFFPVAIFQVFLPLPRFNYYFNNYIVFYFAISSILRQKSVLLRLKKST